MKNKKKLGKNGGFYIALCGCAVVVALVSYVSDLVKDDNTPPETEKIALEDTENEEYESYIDKFSEEDEDYETASEPDVVVIEPEEEAEPEPETVEPAEETAANEEVEEFLPGLPAPGKVTAEFSGDTLVRYERLGDWRTHAGIDIAANVGDDVYICENGVVEKIYNNNLGGCILVDHQNGYKSLYAGLGETDLVNVGDELRTGETIGRVGDSAVGDITAEPHVHFEMYYEGKPVNPLDLIPIE